jgi:hypothetical protein
MANFFLKSLKNPLCWIRQPFFFGRQVAKIRQKKKKNTATLGGISLG